MDFLAEIRRRARDRPRRIVLPEGEEPRTLEAVATIQSEGLLYPVLLGDPERIRDELRGLGGDPGDVEVVDPRVSEGAGGFVETLLELRRLGEWIGLRPGNGFVIR